MPRRAAPSENLLARVRAHFGLQQAELALFLGLSEATVRHIESGKRRLSGAVLAAVWPLLPHLPPAAVAADSPLISPLPPLPPATPAPDPHPLDVRRRTCLQQAARLRAEAAALAARAQAAHHWARVLPAVQAATAETDAAAIGAAATEPDAARAIERATERAAWRRGWLANRATPLPPADVTRWHLLRARLAALEAEAAALAPPLT